MRAFAVEGVLVVVEIDHGVGAEVDRVGAGDEGAVVVVGIENLHGQRFPAAGGAAVDEARPALADAAELFFDGGDEFGFDGVAIGAEVGGVHRVGIVVVRIGVLELHDQHAREVRAGPLLVELVRLFLLDAVVAGDVEALAVVGLEIGIGRLGAEVVEVGDEVIVKDDQRVVGSGDARRILRAPARWRR